MEVMQINYPLIFQHNYSIINIYEENEGYEMFGLSMWEIIIIALVILFVVGPKRLPDVAKSIGKGYGEFKRTFNEMKQSVSVDDNTAPYTAKRQVKEDKIQTYAEQYKSQWEDKFEKDDNAEVKKSRMEDDNTKNS